MHPLESYLKNLGEIRATGGGVPEQSYYGALETLLNQVGSDLKPRVRCVPHVADTGGGEPDYGLYTADQFQISTHNEPLSGQLPERGVIEVKPAGDDSWVTADGDQVTKYWGHYNQILVSNYRDFVFVGQDEAGGPLKLETYRLASDEADFWCSVVVHPRRAATEQGQRFVDYLRRTMVHAAPLSDPQNVAWFLASYAREANARIEAVEDLPGLAALRDALQESLGLRFEGEQGEHFFRATLVQTLFYGIFSSWVLWSRDHRDDPSARFNWHGAAWNLQVPMIGTLFQQIATPSKLKPLRLDEVLDWTALVLNRVVRDEFFRRFQEERAIQYFYEPFLQAYDASLRKELGVWYTPPEIIKYQVARVDMVLREELDVEDGLADPRVYVLDPCCGTGGYLVEVLRKIHQTLQQRGGDALTAQRVKQAAMERVFGFQILPAPFVVAHLQLGLALVKLGAPLSEEASERVGVYLSNALTGWEPPDEPKRRLPLWPELQAEREAAEKVKREVPILVILGNPPYNAFAGRSPEEEEGLVEEYKGAYKDTVTRRGKQKEITRYRLSDPESKGGWGIKKFNLDDPYVRFFRIAERRIVKGGKGVVSYISNFSYLSGPSFVVMRKWLLNHFDKIWIDCMNGDSRETGKLTPEGKPDPSVFSTEFNREGIRLGTAVVVMVRTQAPRVRGAVRFRHFWGVKKRAHLVRSLESANMNRDYEVATPTRESRYSFRPQHVADSYHEWPAVTRIAQRRPYNGPIERRGNCLIVFGSETEKLEVLRLYLDPAVSDAQIEALEPRFMRSSGEFDATQARRALEAEVQFDASKICAYPFKPFDVRLAYLDVAIAPLFSRPAPDLLEHASIPGNGFFITRDTADKWPEGPPFFFSHLVCDYDSISGHARHFPVLLLPKRNKTRGLTPELFAQVTANLSDVARDYLRTVGIADPDKDVGTAALVWMHCLAVGYSPAYLKANADGIRQGWPRIPLPDSKELLMASAQLGEKIAALLDTQREVSGVAAGRIRAELKCVGVVCCLGGGSLRPEEGDLAVTAGWGYAAARGTTMPGRGAWEERAYSNEEFAAIRDGAERLALQSDDPFRILGRTTFDIFLNDVAYWRNVPAGVWSYQIGGYQVIKKWLSYREEPLLGRGLKMDEADYVTEMVRRIAAIRLLEPALDDNYRAVKASTYPWPKQ